MTTTLLRHQWLAFWRSKNTGKSIAVRVVMAVLILYLFANLLVLSFFLDEVLENLFPEMEAIPAFSACLLYYFLLDILMRFQLQELPTLSVKPYLTLAVPKHQIVNYLSVISLASGFNLAPFILFTPFLVKIVLPQAGFFMFAAFSLSILAFTLFNHFFSLWLKRKVNLNAWYMLAFMAVIGLLAFLDFRLHLISFSAVSTTFFGHFASSQVLPALYLGAAFFMYLINFYFLKSNLYLDELRSAGTAKKSGTDIPFLNHFGRPGDLVATELKLIFRNKRPKSAVLMCVFFLSYGQIFYNNPEAGTGYFAPIFCGMFITGIFIINYGQFMFSWQSSHFDGILTSRISAQDFFKSKLLLFTIFATISFVVTLPYVYFGWRIILVHFIMYLWNIGVNTVLVLYFANRNYRRIDLSKSASFNWEGVGATQWILSIPLLISPFLVFFPLQWLGYPEAGLAVLAITGLAFLITRQFWLNKLVAIFKEKRYMIAEGFRNL